LKKEIESYTRKNTCALIIDGHYSHEIVPSKFVTKVFVLRRAPWKLKYELNKRGYSNPKIWENIEAEMIGICLIETMELFEEEKICEIDTSNLTIEEAANLIYKIIEKRESCNKGGVDWMSSPKSLELLKGKI
jgi:adenylate kinase